MAEKQEWDEPQLRQGLDVVGVVQVILKRKLVIIAICAVTALLSCVYSLRLPDIYAATTKVLPPQKEGAALSSVLGQMGGMAGLAAGAGKGESELYLSLLKSRSLGTAVIERLGLAKVYQTKSFNQTWRRLDGAVKVQAGRDGIIQITVEDPDPRQAALLANTMADELGRTMVRLNLSKVGAERLFLEKRLEVVKRDLNAAEDDLRNFSQRHQIVQVDAQTGATVSNVAKLKSELAAKETSLAVLRTTRSDENYEVQELQAGIKRLRQTLAGVAGRSGGGEGIPSVGDVPGLGLEYARKMRDLRTQETLFEQLTKQYELAKLNQSKDSSSLQVLDEAVVPDLKVRPNRASMVLMATVFALIASLVFVFLLEFVERMTDEQKELFRELKRLAFSLR